MIKTFPQIIVLNSWVLLSSLGWEARARGGNPNPIWRWLRSRWFYIKKELLSLSGYHALKMWELMKSPALYIKAMIVCVCVCVCVSEWVSEFIYLLNLLTPFLLWCFMAFMTLGCKQIISNVSLCYKQYAYLYFTYEFVSFLVNYCRYVDVSTVDAATSKLICKHIKQTGASFLEVRCDFYISSFIFFY